MGNNKAPLLLKLLSGSFSRKNNDFKKIDKKVVFIISTGRTGTKYLADLLDSQPNVTALHEPKPSRILRMWSFAYLSGKVSELWMKHIFYKKRLKILSDVDTPIYVESNPYLIGFLDVLPELFKDPVLIHVVRDPRDFVRSSMNHGNKSGIKLFFNNYVPYWYPDIADFLQSKRKLGMEEKAAGYWSLANEHIVEAAKSYSHYHRIGFEDLFDKDSDNLNQIAEVVGLDKIEVSQKHLKPINKSKKSVSSFWDKWPNEKIQFVNKVCNPLMEEFDYGTEKEWRARLKDS